MLNMSNDSQPVELTLYPELEENPDCIAIAERCELLAAILMDSTDQHAMQPVLRCMQTYLLAMKSALGELLSDVRILQLTAKELPAETTSCFNPDSELLLEYCEAVTHTLISVVLPTEKRENLVGLLYDLCYLQRSDLTAPRFTFEA